MLVDSFGWPGKHIFQFRTADNRYSLPEMHVEDWGFGPDPLHAEKTRLYSVMPEVGSTLIWDYNFNEAWTHNLMLEKIRPIKDGDTLPWVLDGKMAVPPTGCGGMLHYRDLVASMADPAHMMRAHWMERTGGKFDPKAFSVNESNTRLEYMQYDFGKGRPGKNRA